MTMKRLTAFMASACMAAAMPASAQQATEIYIPIGKSPGLSPVKTRIGRIQSLAAARAGMTLETESGPTYVAFDPSTKIYVQHADPARVNQLGTYADCQAGLMAEAYVADDGKLRWIKVLVP